MAKPKGIYLLSEVAYGRIYGEAERAEIASLVDIVAPQQTPETVGKDPSVLRDVEVIFSGWGAPKLDAALLGHAAKLKLLLYGAGSVRPVVSDALWDKGVRVSSAYGTIAVAVSEYALAWTIVCLKRLPHFERLTRAAGKFVKNDDLPGAYGSTVGVVSLGVVGRRVCELLKVLEVKVIAYDPFATPETARKLGVELCGLEELFGRADVVTLHTPWLKETEGMIRGSHIRSMKHGAGFINSSRGAIVAEAEMAQALAERPDIQAVLDVTYPEPPASDSPLFRLPNVILTPHMAGSMGPEVKRQGRTMIEELKRWQAGQPLQWEITREKAAVMA
jgi:phosphoglycerate dehydrogenase-like enzyme